MNDVEFLHRSSSRRTNQSRVARYTLIYIALSFLWIGFSDRVLLRVVSDPALLLTLSTLKGWFFVVASAALWHTMMMHNTKKTADSQSAYRTLFNSSPIPITLTRLADGKFLDANDRFLDISGYSQEEILGHTALELNAYPDPEDQRAIMETLRRDRKLDGRDQRFRSKSGDIRDTLLWMELVSIEDEDFILSLALDVTGKKKTEADLARESHQNRVLLRTSSDGIHVMDIDGNVLEVSDSFCTMLGYSRDELLGMNVTQWDARGTGDGVRNELQRLSVVKDTPAVFETKHRRRDGSIFDVEISSTALELNGVPVVFASSRNITERKKAQEALLQSEKRYRFLAENMSDVVWILDAESMRFTYVSPSITQLSGFTPEETMAQSALDSLTPVSRAFLHAVMPGRVQQVLSGETPDARFVDEIEQPRIDGTTVWTEVATTYYINSETGRIEVHGVSRNIQDRKAAELELRKINKAVEASGEIIFLTDRNGVFTLVNPEFTRVYGYVEQEVVGKKTPRILKGGGVNGEDYALFWKRLLSKEVVKGEMLNKAKDGRKIPVEVTVSPILEESGQIEGFLAIQRDIADRKRAEEALRSSEIGLAEAQRIAHLGSWEWDIASDSVTWSKELYDITGLSSLDPPPPFQEQRAFVPDSLERLNEAVLQAQSKGLPYELELEMMREDGARRWVAARGEPTFNAERAVTGLRGTILDITDRKNLESQLLQAQRMESVGTLSAGVAHDFNNILNIISGNLRLIAENPGDQAKNRERIGAISGVTERGARLVRQLQFFARKTEPEREAVDINAIIAENAKILDETFPKTIAVALQLEKGLPPVLGDPNQLHQVLLNLSVNARDAVGSGGIIIFTTTRALRKDVRKHFPDADSNAYIKMSVKDTGMGMDKETRRRIFDPFFTTKEVGRGTGLGLSVALGIIERHRGFIDVESEAGKGSDFIIYLPIAEGVQVKEMPVVEKTDSLVGGHETILFVDDEEFARELAIDQFSGMGYTVLTAADGMSAVAVYKKHMKEISIVLSDLGLPIFDGEEVFRRMKQLNPEVKFVLLTGLIEQDKIGRMREVGIHEIVHKPYRLAEVLSKMRTVLDGSNQRKK